MSKNRIDILLVDRQLFPTRTLAQSHIIAGNVICDGIKITKPGQMISLHSKITLKKKLKYVSRGGLKLERALKQFSVAVKEKICLDIGSSTGGFTDCLLQHGTKKVYCVDSGTNQLAYSLRVNAKVKVFENTNARYLNDQVVDQKIDICVVDVSFISVLQILPSVLPLLKETAKIIILIKPQFEGTQKMLSKGGIVKKNTYHIIILENLIKAFNELGLVCQQLIPSPILGRKGNREYLCLLGRKKGNTQPPLFLADIVALQSAKTAE